MNKVNIKRLRALSIVTLILCFVGVIPFTCFAPTLFCNHPDGRSSGYTFEKDGTCHNLIYCEDCHREWGVITTPEMDDSVKSQCVQSIKKFIDSRHDCITVSQKEIEKTLYFQYKVQYGVYVSEYIARVLEPSDKYGCGDHIHVFATYNVWQKTWRVSGS